MSIPDSPEGLSKLLGATSLASRTAASANTLVARLTHEEVVRMSDTPPDADAPDARPDLARDLARTITEVEHLAGMARAALAEYTTHAGFRDPFDTTPLTDALHAALTGARETMEEAGFSVNALVLVGHASHESAPDYVSSAVAYPMNAWESHARMCVQAAEVFTQAAEREAVDRLHGFLFGERPSEN